MNAKTGKGVVIMTNSDNGSRLMPYLVRSVAREYGWQYTPSPDPQLPR